MAHERRDGGVLSTITSAERIVIESTTSLLTLYQYIRDQVGNLMKYLNMVKAKINDNSDKMNMKYALLDRSIITMPSDLTM